MIKIIKKLSIFLTISLLNFAQVNASSGIVAIGDESAKITVKVFSSLTCPHCASFHDKIFDQLKKDYIDTKKVKFEHHGFPLDLAALNAEKVLRSIKDKDKSFEFLGEIYKKQNKWAVGSDIEIINESIKEIGSNFGLNKKRMEQFIKDENIQDQILNERINAQKRYKISSTPTIYVNKKKYEGKHEYKDFKKFLEKLL